MRYEVRTLGCKANLLDSQQIEAELQRHGWRPHAGAPDQPLALAIVNSCSVTDEADRQSRKLASKLSREHPEATTIVTGCSAEIDPERLARSHGIHYVIGNRDKKQLVGLILKALEKKRLPSESAEILGSARSYAEILSHHPMDREWPDVALATPHVDSDGNFLTTRAFLKIQEGCNSFCTYCIIPYGRGPSRSIPPEQMISQVRALIDRGIQEVVITGTNIGDYGSDWGEADAHVTLFERILRETPLPRLRLSSLDPTEITDRLIELMSREPRLCPHFHVSLQSPHPRILKLMKRRYGFEEVKSCLERISHIPSPTGVFVGMDVITGFPGESNEEFEWTLQALAKLPWTRLHVFPYSEREGTPATRLPGSVVPAERKRRALALRELSLRRLRERYQTLLDSGSRLADVLLERPSAGWQSGYTPGYLRVRVPAGTFARGAKIAVYPKSLEEDVQSGEVTFSGDVDTRST